MSTGAQDRLRIHTFGSLYNADEFLDRARGSAVVKFSTARVPKTPSFSDATSTGMNELIGLNVAVGIVSSDAQFASQLHFIETPPMIDCEGWDLTSATHMTAQKADRPLFPEVTLRQEDVGIGIENPQTFYAGEGVDHVKLLASSRAAKSTLTVAGMEDIRETIERLLQNDGPSYGICRELARLVQIGLVLCENPQIVERTEDHSAL